MHPQHGYYWVELRAFSNAIALVLGKHLHSRIGGNSCNNKQGVSRRGRSYRWQKSSNRTLNVLIAFATTAFLISISCSISAATDSGPARVVDGDGLFIEDAEYRLHGIDAVEGNQGCHDSDGKLWLCGQKAKNTLKAIVANKTVDCEWQSKDRHGRRLATCFVDGIDLGKVMVYTGYAVAYRRYSGKYVPSELEARKNRSGIWSGTFIKPEEHRRSGIKLEVPPPDRAYPIKGNISRKGNRYYHCPGDRSYAATQISEAKGEQWFKSAQDAEAAGWLRPQNMELCELKPWRQ